MFQKFSELTEKIKEDAQKLEDLTYTKQIDMCERDINVQLKMESILDDQIINIQATKEIKKTAALTPNYILPSLVNTNKYHEESSFDSDGSNEDVSGMYYPFITGYDDIFHKKVRAWNKDYPKTLTMQDHSIGKSIASKVQKALAS
jgi:hypothetical protein